MNKYCRQSHDLVHIAHYIITSAHQLEEGSTSCPGCDCDLAPPAADPSRSCLHPGSCPKSRRGEENGGPCRGLPPRVSCVCPSGGGGPGGMEC